MTNYNDINFHELLECDSHTLHSDLLDSTDYISTGCQIEAKCYIEYKICLNLYLEPEIT